MGTQTPISQMPTFDDFMDELDSEGYLEHYGTKGHSGRYPLGSGDRPYQDYGGLSPRASKKAKKAYDRQKEKTEKKQKKEAKKAAVEKAKEEKKKADEEAEAKKKEEEFQKERKKVLQDPGKLAKNQYNEKYAFTSDEIKNAMQGFDWNEKLNTYSYNKMKNTKNKIDKVLDYADVAVRAWNVYAGTRNSIDKSSTLPIIKLDKDNRSDIEKRKSDAKKEARTARINEATVDKMRAEAEQIRSATADAKSESKERQKMHSEAADKIRQSNAPDLDEFLRNSLFYESVYGSSRHGNSSGGGEKKKKKK